MRLGDQIVYTAVLMRVMMGKEIITWEAVTVPPHTGTIVGRRTLQTGTVLYTSEHDDYSGRTYSIREWQRLGSVPAVLVAF